MKPCSFTIFCKHAEAHSPIVDDLCQSLSDNGFYIDDEHPRVIIVLGGDGSLLNAFHTFGFDGQYIMINTGHLGFFADYRMDDYRFLIQDMLEKEPSIEEMPLLNTTINGKKESCVSDIAIQSERTCQLALSINDVPFTEVRCNGIVIGTNTGSTGYLLSLGSPVSIHCNHVYQYHMIAPVVNKLFLNPINSAILSKDDILTINIKDGDCVVLLDGIPMGRVEACAIKVELTDTMVQMIHFKDVNQISRMHRAIQGEED